MVGAGRAYSRIVESEEIEVSNLPKTTETLGQEITG